MGQPTPPGDMPLYDGLGSDWNDIVGAFPEEKRAELAPLLKSKIDQFEPLKQWEDFQKQGITPDNARAALNLLNIVETRPQQVYETIGNYLGLTPQQAQQAVKEVQQTGGLEGADEDPRIANMEQQLQTLIQIQLAQRQQNTEEQQIATQEAALNKEMETLKTKYGEVDEEEVLMRMLHKNMTAEQAYQEYSSKVDGLRQRRPAPTLMGNGGNIPNRAIDPVKLNNSDTKNLVAQMLEHAQTENRK